MGSIHKEEDDMALLGEKDIKEISKIFEKLKEPVKIIMFTQDFECPYCGTTRELLEELSKLSEKLTLEVYDFVKDKAKADAFGIDKIPAVVLMGERDYGIRFYGIPAGYEFSSLLDDIVDVSNRNPGLPEKVLDELAKVDKPVHLQVMVTPT